MLLCVIYAASENRSAMFWTDWKRVYRRRPVMFISQLIAIQLMTMVYMPYGN